ncbi:phycobiliprotein lyase [Synechococcus sp. CS-1328]|nr:phycobiliprotein lyase [Synechococcus sp. CS-1328]
MSLRSLFGLGQLEEGANGDEWHSSERGELVVAYLKAEHPAEPGGLLIAPKGHPERSLVFDRQGGFRAAPAATGTSPEGSWQLWPDGSLELRLESGGTEVRERIWFTKPNLRLRSTVEHRADGSPGRASFSSEIRRVSRAAAPGASAA